MQSTEDGFMLRFPEDFLNTRNKWSKEAGDAEQACKLANNGKPSRGLGNLYREFLLGEHQGFYLQQTRDTPEKKDRKGMAGKSKKSKDENANAMSPLNVQTTMMQILAQSGVTDEDAKKELMDEFMKKLEGQNPQTATITTTQTTPTTSTAHQLTGGNVTTSGPQTRSRTNATPGITNTGGNTPVQPNAPSNGVALNDAGNAGKTKKKRKRKTNKTRTNTEEQDDESVEAEELTEEEIEGHIEARKKFKTNYNLLSHVLATKPKESDTLLGLLESFELLATGLNLNPFDRDQFHNTILNSDNDEDNDDNDNDEVPEQADKEPTKNATETQNKTT